MIIGEGVGIDLPKLVATRLLIQANSGGGKSWAIRRLLEQTHGQVQHIVIDPEGEFASLREKFDYVLASPKDGDTTAEPRYAKLLAHRLLELNASAIIDIYELPPHDRVRFAKLFLDAMINAPKSLWHPVLVVLDEAHNYCPQNGQAESADAVKAMSTRGRKRGFCLIPATQRLAKLHKDVAAECNNKLIGRCTLDVDMKRAAEELGFTTRDEIQQLRKLSPGDFFAFGPALSDDVKRVHVGAVRTSHPEIGHAFVAPAPTAKIKALLPKLADLPAEAEQEARDVESLRRELAETRRKLTLAEKNAASACGHDEQLRVMAEQKEQVERDVAELNAKVTPLYEQAQKYKQHLADIASGLRSIADNLAGDIRDLEISDEVDALLRGIQRPTPKVVFNRREVAPRPRPNTNGHTPVGALDGPERRILNAVVWLEAIGVENPEQPAVAFLAGYTYGGGAFNNPRGRLRGRGLVEYVGGDRIRSTDEGRAIADPPDVPLTNDALHEAVLNRLEGPQRRLLAPLIERYPESMSNDELAEAAGYTPIAGAFNNPRGRLRSLGLIDYPQPGWVVAKPLLFPEESSRVGSAAHRKGNEEYET
jgi:hypothetical protein